MTLNRFVKKLPGVLQTEVQKEFYAATFDQLFNPANVEQAQGFIGRRTGDVLDPLVDNYLDEPNKNRAAYQLEPIAYAVNAALQDSNHLFYADLLNYIEHRGGTVSNHDRLFSDLYYSFAPPIDIDKFLNYQNYLWLEATNISNTAPTAFIQAPLSTASEFDAIINSEIIGAASFNTSSNVQLTPGNFEFSSGMRIQFEGSASFDTPLYVECVGRSIRLVEDLSVLGFDRLFDPVTGDRLPPDLSVVDYITVERGSCEGSPWSRSNRWFHEDAVDSITALGQILSGTIINGGVNYAIGDPILVNIGDGINGSFVVTSIALGGIIDGITVLTRGTGYSFAQADQTGALPATPQPLQWDNETIGGLGSGWDPNNIATAASGFLTVLAQTEVDFDNVSPNGTFIGGGSYNALDTITMNDGTVVRVDTVVVGVITQFTIITSSTSLILSPSTTLTQSSTTGGGSAFTLTLDINNELGVTLWDDDTIVTGAGSGAVIDGVLASAVSRTNKASRPILEFKKDIELFDFGNRFIGEVDVVAATENFDDIHGTAAGTVVDNHILVDGDILIFLNPVSIPTFLEWDKDPDAGFGTLTGSRWDESVPVTTTDAATLAFADANPDTITRAGGASDFLSEGFTVGQTINISGSASNNGDFLIAGVTALVITLDISETLVTEGAVAAVLRGYNTTTAGTTPWDVSGATGSLTRFVWRVDLVTTPGTIILDRIDLETGIFPTSVTVDIAEDILITQGDVYTGEMFYQFEDIFSGTFTWELAQSKNSANIPPLFNLYDGDGITLDDTTAYPTSDFIGNEIYSYKILTQERLTEQGGGMLVNDSVLGFPLETKGFRELGDVIFENDLEANRTNFIPTASVLTEIPGYYFFKVFNTAPDDCEILGSSFETNWKSSTGPEELRVIDRFLTTTEEQDTFPVSGVPVEQILGAANFVVTQGRRLNSSEFAYLAETQEMKLLAKATVEEAAVGNGTQGGYTFVGIDEDFQVYLDGIFQIVGTDLSNIFTDYIITAQSAAAGTSITFSTIPADGVAILARQQASGAPGINKVVEILTYTFDDITEDQLGYFEVPNELENNPTNLEVIEQSWNEFTPHYTSIITEQAVYEGTAFGAGNNYRDTLKDGSLGTFILQNQSPLLKTMLCTSADELDIVDGMRLSGDEYTRFRNKFIKIGQQLVKEGFTPQQIGDQIPVSEWVDEAIRRIIRAREFDTAFDNTYMVAWNTVYQETVFTATGANDLYSTPNFADLTDKRNVLYVYIDEILQLTDRDYTITNFNPIQITTTTTATIGASVVMRIFTDSSPAHIPATPSKLGLYTVFQPEIVVDNTYANSTQVIIGHDGSKTPIYNSVIDELLLEFETRIYNGILSDFRTDYIPPLQRDTYKPGKFRSTRWTLTEWQTLNQQSFFKWVAANKADYITNGFYVNADPFTWNYDTVTDVDGLLLPGFWRGIFDFYYDTQTPESTPWEMLGFEVIPTWWETTADLGDGFTGYGTTPWVDTDPMWVDLENGLVRRQIDKATGDLVIGFTDTRYVRVDLITKYLPVDTLGALKASPLLAIDTSSSLVDPTDTEAQADYNWVDWAPVEYAWRTSESYPFALAEALFLARPGEFGEKFWDPEHIFEVPVDNEQIVSSDMGIFKRIGNSTLLVHGETVSGMPQIQTGYQVWIAGRLKALKKDITVDFGDLLRSLDVKLGHKMAGFTDKDTLRVFVEGISVTSNATNLLVPSENIDVALYTGTPVRDYFYTGVLIRALANDIYQVFGYDITAGRFTFFPRIISAADQDVTVGGQPEAFVQFRAGDTYLIGSIVRLNGIFYRAIETHVADIFDVSKWVKLPKLPITGGVSVTYKVRGADSESTIEYGHKFNGVQEVFDFLVGLGQSQSEAGWTFETVNSANNTINNWVQAAKDYLFWVGTQWEVDSLIMLSPMAEKVILNVKEGYPDNVEQIINGTYSILDKNGVAIDPINTIVNREDRRLEIEPDIEQTGIYGMRAITRETENIVTFDNTTVFNDILYDPVLGSRLARLDFRGRRTLEWTGKLEAAGFIITADGLLPNYENMVDSIRNYHNTEVLIDSPDIESTARHLIGFDDRDYFTDLGILDDAQFQFYQGLVRQKGTRQAIEKMERNKLVTNTDDELNIIEEWALKIDDFGAVCINNFTEFLIVANEVKVDPQLVQLSYPASETVPPTYAFDSVNDVTTGDDTITIVGHGYRSGAPKTYSAGGGTVVPGLTDNTVYYVVVVTTDTFSLATTKANATALTPVVIDLTGTGVGVAHTLTAFPTGVVTDIDIVSATNVYTIPPTVFITNHPDDLTGSGALAVSVLDTDSTLLRIDVIVPGSGYSNAPDVAIGLPSIGATSDRATSQIRFDVVTDVSTDDVIIIDIDDETRWITKPAGVACDVAGEIWPDTVLGVFNTTNAGYVHSEDVDFQSFTEGTIDALSTAATIPTTHGETIWVARDAREEFGVYVLDGYKGSTILSQDETDFDSAGTNGTFVAGTGYIATEVITMSDGTQVTVDTVSSGAVVTFDITLISTTAFANRAGTTLTTGSSNGLGNNDFTLTLGIANEAAGGSLPGIGATLTQTPAIEDDGLVTLTSIPREDLIEAQFTIDVDGAVVDGVTIIDGGFGYVRNASFTISTATHPSGNGDATINYTVDSFGVIDSAVVGAPGSEYYVTINAAIINAGGAGYSINDVLTVVGGTGVAATLTVDEVGTIATQDETDFNSSPTEEGTFTAGIGHAIADVITLSDGSTITIDNATIATIAGQDETDFDNSPTTEGTFSAGVDYFVGEVLTMSDGTVVQIEACSSNGDPLATPLVGGPISEFRIVIASTVTTIFNNEVLSVPVGPPSGGQGFTLTLDVDNAQTTTTTGVVTEFTVTTASTSGITTQAFTVAQASTTGTGTNFALNLGADNQSVFDVAITTRGEYSDDASLPSATAAATTVIPVAGTGATVDLTFFDDDIVVSFDDIPEPTGWRRFMGNSVLNQGQIYANNVLYDYTLVSGSTFTLSKNGVAIEDETLADNTEYFTLVNLRYRTIAERTIFEPTMNLIGDESLDVDGATLNPLLVWTDDNGSGLFEVSAFTAPSTFTATRTQEEYIETFKFKNAFVYENDTKDTLAQIPVYDPFKGIIPGNADLNLTWKQQRDPARYTNGSATTLVDADLAFDGDQVGLLWWDQSTSAYLHYEQGTDEYRRDNWGKLFPGSSVDIYEWTRSTGLPTAYTGDGTVRNVTDYTTLEEWDPILEEVRTFFYFWVKDRTEIPGGVNRTIAAFEVANIIANPAANLYQWFSPISQTAFMFSGVDGVFTDSDNVFQINFRRSDDERPTHVEWELGRENDPSYIINDTHWEKMVDSLVGYTVPINIGAQLYTDAVASFNTDATGVDGATEIITTLTDHGFSNGDGARYSDNGGTSSIGLIDDIMYYVEVSDANELYLHREARHAAPIPPAVVNPATRLNLGVAALEVHTLTVESLELNNFNNALPVAGDPEMGFLIVPDPSLSTANQLGIRTRPVQSMFLNILPARRVYVDKINQLVESIALRDDNPMWNASLTTNTLWEYVDWFAVGFDATNTSPIRQVDDTSDLASLANPFDGDIVKVTGTRFSLYEYSADTGLYTLIMREATRLNLLASIYTDEPSLAASLELRELIEAIRTQVFVDDITVNNNLTFFAMLNYVFSEQDDLDWAFKTTYIFLDQTGQVLSQPRVFQEDPFDSVLDYITEAKPYQTKVRDFRVTRETELDVLPGTASETLRNITAFMRYDQVRGGDLSVTEMRIAKFEGGQSTSYDGMSDLDAGATLVRLGAAGRAVNNYRIELVDIQGPTGSGITLSEFDPAQTGVATTTEELEAVAAINAAITLEFFFDFQGTFLQNTSFGGLPTLGSFAIEPTGGTGYIVGEILSLDAGSGTPVSNAQFRVSTIGGSGEITALDLIDGGSYIQTPTVDPVDLLGGSGTSGQLTALIFENGSSVPHDTTPWDQIGFESSVNDPNVTTLDGSPDNLTTTVPGSTQANFDGIFPNGSFAGGIGYKANTGTNLYTDLTFTQIPGAATIVRVGGTAFDAVDEFTVGQKLIVTLASDSDNNGTFTIAVVTATTITLSTGDVLVTDANDATAEISGFDTIIMQDGPNNNNGSNITVDVVDGSGTVTGFTLTGGSTEFIIAGDPILQASSNDAGTGFVLTTGTANTTEGTFADVPAEESFSGNGSTKEFAITTTVPTFFMFVVIDGVEQTLNVDFFFIGTQLTFIIAPPSGTNNIQLFTYIEAGDLINPQVSAGITEEMVPLDPRENLIVIADSTDIVLTVAGTGYAVGETLTATGGIRLQTTIAAQDETDFDGAGSNGTFTAGADYVVGDVITLNDQSTITVDTVSSGAIATFTVTTASNIGFQPATILSQDSIVQLVPASPPVEGSGFSLTPDTNNEANFGSPLTMDVATTSSGPPGPIATFTVTNQGDYFTYPTSPFATTADASGINATFTLTALSYRIHNDTAQNFTIHRNADSASTTLTATIGLTDNLISVTDESVLFTTDPTRAEPQVAWIGTERIIYHGVNAAVNELTGVLRGTNGTHAQKHQIGAKIFDGGDDQVIPISNVYWVDSATAGYDSGAAGQWRYTGLGNVHFSDASDLTMHTGSSMVVGDALRVTTGTVINKTYFISDLILQGEVCLINITIPGTGYSVGDAVDLTGLGTGPGDAPVDAIAAVGGIDVNGGITYINITNRGTLTATFSSETVLVTATGDGNASIDVFYDREGLELALGGDIIDTNGVVVALNSLAWATDRLLPGGLNAATTTAAIFIQAEEGNVLPISLSP